MERGGRMDGNIHSSSVTPQQPPNPFSCCCYLPLWSQFEVGGVNGGTQYGYSEWRGWELGRLCMPFSLRGERGIVDTLDSSHVFNQTESLPYILLSLADLQVWFLKSSMHFLYKPLLQSLPAWKENFPEGGEKKLHRGHCACYCRHDRLFS